MDNNSLAVKDRRNNKKNNLGKRRNSRKEDVKVVYISSPIKVETSASEFRALVQELTGKDSDIADSHFGDRLPADYSPTKSISGRQTDFTGDDSPATMKGFGENDGESPSFSGHHQPLQMEDGFMEMMFSSSLFNGYSCGYGLDT